MPQKGLVRWCCVESYHWRTRIIHVLYSLGDLLRGYCSQFFFIPSLFFTGILVHLIAAFLHLRKRPCFIPVPFFLRDTSKYQANLCVCYLVPGTRYHMYIRIRVLIVTTHPAVYPPWHCNGEDNKWDVLMKKKKRNETKLLIRATAVCTCSVLRLRTRPCFSFLHIIPGIYIPGIIDRYHRPGSTAV